ERAPCRAGSRREPCASWRLDRAARMPGPPRAERSTVRAVTTRRVPARLGPVSERRWERPFTAQGRAAPVPSRTRGEGPPRVLILPFLTIGATGMLSAEVGELEELRFIDRTKALQSIEANRGLIRGVKVRLSRQQVGPNARVALLTARETAEAARLPLMVHVGDTPIPLDDILIELRAGDVLTHCFHGRPQGVLDEHGRVRAEARRAADRGVTFDVGHGVGS